MELILIYLAKASALLGVFYLAYYLMLRKETFFRSNRWYLLLGVVASVVLPLVTITRTVWIDPADASAWTMVPVEPAYPEEVNSLDWMQIGLMVYATGVLMFMIKFVTDLLALRKILNGKRIIRQQGFRFVDTAESISPFSFFNLIVYNSAMYASDELENIVEHEKAHSSGWHTLDILVARLACIAFWFNPFAWMYRKAVAQNLEYIADREATKRLADKRSYQLTLLKITAHEGCVSISNHFYQSLIKKRIVMLNTNQSKRRNVWKYATILPAIAFFLFAFQVEVIAQEKVSDSTATTKVFKFEALEPEAEVVIDKKTSDRQLKAYSEKMKQEGIALKFSKVRRNKSGEITGIKAEYKDPNGKKGATAVQSSEPIQPLRIYKSMGSVSFGTPSRYSIVTAPGAMTFSSGEIVDIAVSEPPEFPSISASDMEQLKKIKSKVFVKSNDGQEAVIVVNGKKISAGSVDGPAVKSYSFEVIGDVDSESLSEEIRAKVRENLDSVKENLESVRQTLEMQRESGEKRSTDNRELERARKEIEKARQEIMKAREEIEKARAEMNQKK